MKEEVTPIMTPLDAMLNQDQIQILKASIPYLPPQSQQLFTIYAKMMEFFHALSYVRTQPEMSAMSTDHSTSITDALTDIRKFATGSSKEQIDQLLFFLNTIQLIQLYQDQSESMEETT